MTIDLRSTFLADIIAHREDDVPRLIFADWLDDHDDPAKATFIRVQCELARLQAGKHPWVAGAPLADRQTRDRLVYLAACERELLRSRGYEWFFPHGILGGKWSWEFRRGFVHSVRCTCTAWFQHGPAVVRQQPIERVELSDKEPYQVIGGEWGYSSEAEHRQDPDLPAYALSRLLLPGSRIRPPATDLYCSRNAALDALSAACLTWARAQPIVPATVSRAGTYGR